MEEIIGMAIGQYLGAAETVRPKTKYCLPLTEEEARIALLGEYLKGVKARRCVPIDDEETLARIEPAAKWLTDSACKPWLMIYGLPNNGKTILASAIKSVAEGLKEAFNPLQAEAKRQKEANRFWPLTKAEEAQLKQYERAVYVPTFVKANDMAGAISKAQDSKQLAEALQAFETMKRSRFLIIDDMGEEQVAVKVFGNEYFPMIECISYRYDNYLPTVFTSNYPLTSKDSNARSIATIYKDRTEGRLAEMCEKIHSKGDYRHSR